MLNAAPLFQHSLMHSVNIISDLAGFVISWFHNHQPIITFTFGRPGPRGGWPADFKNVGKTLRLL